MQAVGRWRGLAAALLFLSGTLVGAIGLRSSEAATTLTVWPIGDSITNGSADRPHLVAGGYRAPLARALASRGTRIRYVGTIATNPSPLLTGAGQRHDGHSGWQTSQVLDAFGSWQVARPDVVIVSLGTNDLLHGRVTPAVAAARLGHLVTAVTTRFPAADVLVATIVPHGPAGSCDQTTREYDGRVRLLVRQSALLGLRVHLVDSWAAFTYGACSARGGLMSRDGIHPNRAGYRLLARVIGDVLEPVAKGRRTLTS